MFKKLWDFEIIFFLFLMILTLSIIPAFVISVAIYLFSLLGTGFCFLLIWAIIFIGAIIYLFK